MATLKLQQNAKPVTLVPEDEQWRLINESGVLEQIKYKPPQHDLAEPLSLAEEIFNAVVLIMPMSFLLLLMEILIHFQYGKHPTFQELFDRMVSGVPIMSIFIFYTTRYKAHRRMQFFLFFLSIIVGSRLVYLVNLGPWLLNMKQCPPLATLWVYTIVQLELAPAVLALSVVGIYVWWRELRILPR